MQKGNDNWPYLTKLDRSLIVAKESYYPLQGGRVDFAASDAFFVL